LIPLYAVERLETEWTSQFPEFTSNLNWFLKNRQNLVKQCVTHIPGKNGETLALSIVNHAQLLRMLHTLCDPDEFLSEYGLRSLSKRHRDAPFVLGGNQVSYEPGEADCKIKGGNSNWRGPIWFPTAFLMIESLRKLAKAYGDDVSVVDAQGKRWTIGDIARTHAERLIKVFARDAQGQRPQSGSIAKFQHDPHWRDYLHFHEYFHGDTGVGLGAAHQTGWTGLIASLIDEWRGH
jgi:hypothetical protein